MAQTIGSVIIDIKADTQKLVTGFQNAQNVVSKSTTAMKNAVTGLTTAYLSLSTIDAFGGLIKGSIDAAKSMESMNMALNSAVGSTKLADKELSFLSKTSLELGTDLRASISGFTQFAAAAKGTSLQGEETEKVFRSVSVASTVMGLSVDDQNGVFRALSQMMSKGKVQAEELRGQLGERLPGAFQIAARSMNMTTKELDKFMSDGKLLSDDFLPKFAKQLQEEMSDKLPEATQTARAEQNRFNNAVLKLKLAIANSGLQELEKDFYKLGSSIVLSSTNIDGFIDTTKEITKVAASVTTAYLTLQTGIKITQSLATANAILGSSYFALNSKIVIATASQVLFNKALKASPLAITATAIYELANSFIDASDRAKTFSNTLNLVDSKARLKKVNQDLKEFDDRLKGYNDSQKLMYKGAYDLMYKEKLQLEENIKLIEESNKKKSKHIDPSTKSNKNKKDQDTKELQDQLNTSTAQWQSYYERLGDYEKAWELQKAQLTEQYGYENATKLYDIYKEKFEDKIKATISDPIAIPLSPDILDDSWIDEIEDELSSIYDVEPIVFNVELDTNNTFDKLTKEVSDFYKLKQKYEAIEHKSQQDTQAFNQAQIVSYSNMAGAMSSMFEQGSKEAQAFTLIQNGLAIANGVNAILTQGQGDPYTAFARIAAMTALVVSTLSQANIAFGGSGQNISYDNFSAMSENTGSGTVLGDSQETTQSLQNSLDILTDFAKPEFNLLSKMSNSLQSIDEKMGGVSSSIFRTGGFALGDGWTDISNDNTLSSSLSFISGAESFNDMGNILNDIGLNWVSSGINSIASGIFGGGSSTTLSDYGISISSQNITDAISNIDAAAYQTTKTETDGGWFHSDSTSYNTTFQELDTQISRQYELIFKSLYDTIELSGTMLDTSIDDIDSKLSAYTTSIDKMSLKDKTGDEVEEQLNNMFSAEADKMVKTVYGSSLDPFTQVGEGLFETLTRVSAGMEEASNYTDKLGKSYESINYQDIINKNGNVAVEALTQSITAYDEAIYGANNNVVQMIDNINSSADDIYTAYTALYDMRIELNMLGLSYDDLSSSMLKGADGIDALADSIESYYENFTTSEEQTQIKTALLTDEFSRLGLELPVGVNGFIDLVESIDTSTESGQELYGRVISLSDSFVELSGSLEENEANIKAFKDSFKTSNELLEDMATVYGVSVAKSYSELGIVFEQLSNDMDGLNDTELDLLQANKDYIATLRDDAVKEKTKLLNDEKTVYNDYLNETTSSITSLENAFSSISDTIFKLNTATQDSDYALQSYYDSMAKTLELSHTTDYEAYTTSLNDTIAQSAILYDSSAFDSSLDQEFAQKVALNQFNLLKDTTADELDYLELIQRNTQAQIEAIDELNDSLSVDLDKYNIEQLQAFDSIVNTLDSNNIEQIEKLIDITNALNSLDLSTSTTTVVSTSVSTYTPIDTSVPADLHPSVSWVPTSIPTAVAYDSYTAFADGGIVTKPTMGLIAEAGYNEAIIPLKDPNDPLQMNALLKEMQDLKTEVKLLREQNNKSQNSIVKNTKKDRYMELAS